MENQANQMTAIEVLRITVEQLGMIPVTVSQMEQIGDPILRAIGNINACIEAMERADAEHEKKKQEEAEDAEADAE